MLEKIVDIAKSEKKLYYQKRILSELKFAALLSQRQNGIYDEIIKDAENYIIEATKEEGIINHQILIEAEKILKPISAEAKTYELMCAGHAHIDMNWQWGWDETVKIVLDTTKSILKIMTEYPEFKFSQSQASVYRILEEYAPELLEEVKRRVHEGRWEVSASTWVEADKNMPNNESGIRQILYAKKYLAKLFDISMDDIVIDFEPDTFGHTINTPEILSKANIKYYYHCRGMNDCKYQLYTWRAPSGAEVLVNRERNFYFVDVNPDMAFHAFSTSELTGVKETLHVYGVGDHGGGPTRRDIERLIDMNTWPIYPRFTFSTYREFFEKVEKYKTSLPVYEGEMNCIFDGCFTSQSRNKVGNRTSERLMRNAETIDAVAVLEGKKDANALIESTWKKILLNQFHDIVTGSGVRETREYALGMYQDVKAALYSLKSNAFSYIADRINTAELIPQSEISMNEVDLARAYGAGVGSGQVERGSGNTRIYHIFNSGSVTRTKSMEIYLWEWYGDPKRICIKDAKGNAVPFQVKEKGYNNYWYHNYLTLIIRPTVPAFGYTTLVLTEGKMVDYPIEFHWERRHQEPECYKIENNLLKVIFDKKDLSIISVLDKETGTELVDQDSKNGIFQFALEANNKQISEWRSEMSGWLVGRLKYVQNLTDNIEIKLENGDVRSSLKFKTSFSNSFMETEVYLDRDSRNLCYKVKCDWHEIGNEERGVPRLQYVFPVPYKVEKYIQDTGFGIIEREEKGTDTPAQSFTYAHNTNKNIGIGISSRNTYGYYCENNKITLALLRAPFEPDPYPENGVCESEFCVSFAKNIQGYSNLLDIFNEYNEDFEVVSGDYHDGELPAEKSYFSVEKGNIQISGLKVSEEGNSLVLHLHEVEGRDQTISIKVNDTVKVRRADLTDILEREIQPAYLENNTVSFELKAYNTMAVKIEI